MSDQKLLYVTVRSRQGLVFEGELQTLSSYNKIGLFDVLSQHANFISMIKDRLILTKKDGKKMEISMDSGVIMVQENKVEVYLGVGKI